MNGNTVKYDDSLVESVGGCMVERLLANLILNDKKNQIL